MFAYVGEHGFLKPIDGGGWRDVYHIHNREEFFRAYDQSRDLCMMYQKAVDFRSTSAATWSGRRKCTSCRTIREGRMPSATFRTRRDTARGLLRRVEQDALKLCQALGYDLNTVEFAVENGIPYAIDFMNPAPDADLNSVGAANFEWIVRAVADMAIAKAKNCSACSRTALVGLSGRKCHQGESRKEETRIKEQ